MVCKGHARFQLSFVWMKIPGSQLGQRSQSLTNLEQHDDALEKVLKKEQVLELVSMIIMTKCRL
jgi:hypothetical protein